MRNTVWMGRKFWLNAGLSFSVAGMPWAGAIGLLGTSAIATLTSTPAQAATLSNWEFDSSTQELRVTVPGGTQPRYFLAAEPARIILDLPDTEVGAVPLQQTYGGAIREIRVAQFEPGVARIVLELAPGTVLAPGHVALQQVGEAGEEGDRWVLRPLLATNASVAMATPSAEPTSPDPIAPGAVPSSSLPDAPDAAELPPLEPGATEIPVELPPNETIAPSLTTGSGTEAFTTAGSEAETSEATPAPLAIQPAAGAETATETGSDETGSDQFSEADRSVEADQPDSVRMPGPATEASTPARTTILGDTGGMPAAVATLPALPEASPDALPAASNTASVSVPPLETQVETQAPPPPLTPTQPQGATAAPAASNFPTPSIPAAPHNAAIEFGQPLPKSASNGLPVAGSGNSIAYANRNNINNILLPSGTTLNLRYTGEAPLELVAGEPRQEVLVLAEAVQDAAGNTVLPEGSYVLGRFETGEAGSRFVSQAISLQGQSIPLNAESEPLSGRHPSRSSLFRNSALGAAAGVALGITGIGLIPAIAAGAATAAGITFLPDSQSNVIHPEQRVEVHLTQDLTQVN